MRIVASIRNGASERWWSCLDDQVALISSAGGGRSARCLWYCTFHHPRILGGCLDTALATVSRTDVKANSTRGKERGQRDWINGTNSSN